MKRLKYVLLVLVLGMALAWPAGAEEPGWSCENGSARGVTITPDGDRLRVTLEQPGEYTVWLVSEEYDFEDLTGLPIYMAQHTGPDSFPIVLTEGRLHEIEGEELALWVFGAELTLSFSVRYGTSEEPPAESPSPTPTPSPSPSSRPSQSRDPDDGPSPTPTPSPPPTPSPTPSPEIPQFTDTAGHWGEAYIGEAAARGLFSGYGDGRFGPDDAMTRAQFVTVLWRMAGRPEGAAEPPFTDTGGEIAEFRAAIAWGYDRGYINGVSEDRFEPSGLLTREQAMKILFYFAGGDPGDGPELYDVFDRGYADSAEISSWAREPMYWGVYNGIIAGVGDGLLAPQDTATRAQLAKILIVYMDDVA